MPRAPPRRAHHPSRLPSRKRGTVASGIVYGPVSWERMTNAVELVRRRLLRAAAALDQANLPYAVAGGNAVALWVSRVDQAAVRAAQDVDLLLRREDLPAARFALEQAGFVYRHVAGEDLFLDGPGARARDAVHLVFAGERVRPEYLLAAPAVEESERLSEFTVLALAALVRMKLTSFRDKDRTHLRDMLDVGLLDDTWRERLPEPLAARLQSLLDTPFG